MFYSSHFHHAVQTPPTTTTTPPTSFSHTGEKYSWSGKREHMSAAVACAYRRIHPRAFSVNQRERSHSIQFNPVVKAEPTAPMLAKAARCRSSDKRRMKVSAAGL